MRTLIFNFYYKYTSYIVNSYLNFFVAKSLSLYSTDVSDLLKNYGYRIRDKLETQYILTTTFSY